MKRLAIALSAMAAVLAAPAFAEPLPRQATLGVAIAPSPKADGALVQDIRWADAARAFGLRPGDVIVSVNGAATPTPAKVIEALAGKPAGMKAKIEVRRDGKLETLSGTLVGRPVETFANGSVKLSEVPFEGGQLREFFVTPPGGAEGPVLFIIQGYTCDSVETTAPDSSHRLLIDGLLKRGISTYRVEKPGAGDSRAPKPCTTIDFETELRAFDAGYKSLIEKHGVSPDRIFLLGHSLGGIEAPIMASRNAAPRGVAVYGTVARNWYDYMLDVFGYQAFIGRSGDPAEGEAAAERLRGPLAKVYLEGKSPDAVEAANPADGKVFRDLFGWTGGDLIFDRDYRFWQQLSTRPMLAPWKDTKSDVLVVFGQSDLAAIDDRDHRLITDVVNHYRPGTARFVSVPGTGHGMKFEPLRQTPGVEAPKPTFNTDLIAIFGDWIENAMRMPPVSTRTVAPAAKG